LAHEAQTFVRHHFGVEKAQQLIQTVMRILWDVARWAVRGLTTFQGRDL
jgi:hypothetical protein